MSESREHKRRYNLRLQYIAEFEKWLSAEPPMWRVVRWRRWKKSRPVWVDMEKAVASCG